LALKQLSGDKNLLTNMTYTPKVKKLSKIQSPLDKTGFEKKICTIATYSYICAVFSMF